MAFNQVQGGLQVEEDSAKRAKIGSGRHLSEEEKLERRCEEHFAAAMHAMRQHLPMLHVSWSTGTGNTFLSRISLRTRCCMRWLSCERHAARFQQVVSEAAVGRREGNRKAAQRLRQRRMETVSNLQEEIARLEQERLVYLNHIYQLAASGRSVVSENKMLRARLEALQLGVNPAVRSWAPSVPALIQEIEWVRWISRDLQVHCYTVVIS